MRPRRRLTPAPILLALALSLAAARAAETGTATATAGAHLSIAEPSFAAGTLPQGRAIEHDFRILNSGTAPLNISDVNPSCGCTSAEDWPRTLAPGASGIVRLRVDTTELKGHIVKAAIITSNDARAAEAEIEITADIWTPVELSQTALMFPAKGDGTQPATASLTVTNHDAAPLSIIRVSSASPRFRATVHEITAGQTYAVAVTTVPPLPEGTSMTRITIATNNPRLPSLTFHAVATVLPAVQLSPTELSFPTPELAGPEKRFALILNNRDTVLHVTDVTTNAPGVQVGVEDKPAQSQSTITLLLPAGFKVRQPGKLYVRGRTNQPSLPTFEIPIVFAGDR